MSKQNLIDRPAHRPLKVYAFDPTQGRSLGNYMTVNVRYEELQPGPIGNYLEVIDYDASNQSYYEAVNLEHPYILMRGGLDPSESDPRFHQQMVYAVASETIRRFEFALGRKIKWGFNRNARKNKNRPLRIYPHGMQEANAYYSRELGALVFGYFPASKTDPGVNLPGQTVFTCLSHDIIVHETTHALIDGQRMHFMEATGPDTLAFHEAFADIVALFQHFTFKEALYEMIQRTGGMIYLSDLDPEVTAKGGKTSITPELSASNPLVQLAKQFGEAMGKRAALRSALGTPPNSNELENLFEPHERGAILVAAVFDAFFTVYIRRIRDLLRIARLAGDAAVRANDLHPDLVERLAAEAAKTAEHFLNICIRALDYCPPVDIHFGDFLRAMITADYDLVPEDPIGYRAALIDAFRLRGIYPTNVNSYAEESLRWCPPDIISGAELPRCEGLEFDLFSEPTNEQSRKNAIILSKFGSANYQILGLSAGLPVKAHSFHPVHRVGPDGRLKMEIVAELLQQQKEKVEPDDPNSPEMLFRGGVTLIIDQQAERKGEIRYAIQKNLFPGNDQDERLQVQREYYREKGARFNLNTYTSDHDEDNKQELNFNLIHRGY